MRRRSRFVAGWAVGFALTAWVGTPSASAADFCDVDATMLRLMATYDVPGAALALIRDDKIVLEKGYGFRNLESHAPVTAATLFNIGSISKSFTALGVVQLADRHRIDLDTPVIRYIPDLRLSDPRVTQTVTLRQLLSHSSGLPPDDQWPPQVPLTRDGIVGEFASMPITAQPGTKFQYCSRCIVLAASALERVTGQSWESYIRTQVFEPLGMTAASFVSHGLEQAPDQAQPYRHTPILGDIPIPWSRLHYLEALAPAGGIDANIDEMAHYALLQLGDGALSGHRLLSPQTMAELHRPEIAVGGGWAPVRVHDVDYALGWFTGEDHGTTIVFHNGANPGFRAAIMLAPSARIGVVVLTNGESSDFTDAVTSDLIGEMLR